MLARSRLLLCRSRQYVAVRQASQLKDSYEYVLAEVKGNVGVITVSRIFLFCLHRSVTLLQFLIYYFRHLLLYNPAQPSQGVECIV